MRSEYQALKYQALTPPHPEKVLELLAASDRGSADRAALWAFESFLHWLHQPPRGTLVYAMTKNWYHMSAAVDFYIAGKYGMDELAKTREQR